MTELRWILLVAALLFLGGLFVWTRYRTRIVGRLRLPELRRAGPLVPSPSGGRQEPILAPQPAATGSLPDKVITIRVLSRAGAPFPGEALVLALRECGLQHGRYGIFHAPVSAADSRSMFSVASLTEPGAFDLTRIHTDVYQGVSLFLGLPAPVEGVKAFETMVTAARDVARRLDGNLVDEHGSTLSVQRERYLREEIIQFEHRPGRPA